MKLSKPLLQALAVAVTVAAVSSCTKDKTVDPEGVSAEKKAEKKGEIYNCPACGMG